MNTSEKSPDRPDSRSSKRRVIRIVLALASLCILVAVVFYHYIVSGGLRARQTPSTVETFVAQKLVEMSIPQEDKQRTSTLDASGLVRCLSSWGMLISTKRTNSA